MKTTLSFERLLRVLPPLLTALLVVVCLVVGSRISWSNLLTYTPPNLLLAAAGILALYAVKSLSVVFPLSVLYIACALWFGRWGGLMMCYLGLTVSCTLPYLIGRRFGAGVVEHLIRKYPRLDKLYQAGSSNQVMLSYLLRIVTVLPGDFCSLFLGACSVSYPRYLLGSMLGLSPLMIVHVLLADMVAQSLTGSLWEVLTPQSVGLVVILIGVSILSSVVLNRRWSSR